MEDVKRIPYGISNFVEVVEQNQYYVDKTMYCPYWKSNLVIFSLFVRAVLERASS